MWTRILTCCWPSKSIKTYLGWAGGRLRTSGERKVQTCSSPLNGGLRGGSTESSQVTLGKGVSEEHPEYTSHLTEQGRWGGQRSGDFSAGNPAGPGPRLHEVDLEYPSGYSPGPGLAVAIPAFASSMPPEVCLWKGPPPRSGCHPRWVQWGINREVLGNLSFARAAGILMSLLTAWQNAHCF